MFRRTYGRRGNQPRFERAATSAELAAEAVEEPTVVPVIEPPKKPNPSLKSKNVNITIDDGGESEMPSLDKFMDITHHENTEEEVTEDTETPEPKETIEDEAAQIIDKPAEEKEEPETEEEKEAPATIESLADQVFSGPVVVSPEKKAPVVTEIKSASKVKEVKSEKTKFANDPLASDKPGKKRGKKKKTIVDPLAD